MDNNFGRVNNITYSAETLSRNANGEKDTFAEICILTAKKEIQKYIPNITVELAEQIIRENFRSVLGLADGQVITESDIYLRETQFRQVFDIIRIVVDQKVVDYVQLNEFFKNYVDYKKVNGRTTYEFYVPNRKAIVLNEVAGSTWSMGRERLNAGKTFTISTKNFGCAIYEETIRLINNETGFGNMIDSLTQAVINRMLKSITNTFEKTFEAIPASLKHTGNFDAKQLQKLLNSVKSRNNGSEIVIAGTRTALENLPNVNGQNQVVILSDDMKNQINNLGYLQMWRGYKVVEIPQVYDEELKVNMVSDDKLYILATNDKFIKCVQGDSLIRYESAYDNNDTTTGVRYLTKLGFAGVFSGANGMYKITQ